jgi:hypothetical protein
LQQKIFKCLTQTLKIFVLQQRCPSVIIVATEDDYMNTDQEYITQLEALIVNELLPAREKYYQLLGVQPPDLGLSFEFKLRQKTPALFKPKPKK